MKLTHALKQPDMAESQLCSMSLTRTVQTIPKEQFSICFSLHLMAVSDPSPGSSAPATSFLFFFSCNFLARFLPLIYVTLHASHYPGREL